MEEYSSLIIHSKLLNAYDATTALALTWNASLTKIENEFLNNDIFSVIDNPQYHPRLGQILQDSLENSVSPYNGLAVSKNLNLINTMCITFHEELTHTYSHIHISIVLYCYFILLCLGSIYVGAFF